MRFPTLVLALLLGGCSLLPDSMRAVLPVSAQDLSSAIPLGASIPAPAGRLQDSLRTRLEWFVPTLANAGAVLERLAFAPGKDSSVRLEAHLSDANGWNSHDRTALSVACLERNRWKKTVDAWNAKRRTAALDAWPFEVFLAYRSHDQQWGQARWAWDTLELRLTDSAAWMRQGKPFDCSARP
jgi:hypothetical protein